MTFKIYVGGQRVESERVLGEAWRVTVRGILFEILFEDQRRRRYRRYRLNEQSL
jgi:hypothetical protein